MVSVSQTWDESAVDYVKVPDISNVEINFPACIRYLGNVRHKVVVDYGCGSGSLARQIQRSGASRVIGVDKSERMISLACKADPERLVSYHHIPHNTLSFLPDASVDAVVANLVFMMSEVKSEIAIALHEIYRVLRPSGRLILVITHPCFIEKGAHDYYNIFTGPFSYMEEEVAYRFVLCDENGEYKDKGFVDHHYTLSTYINLLLQSGLRLTGFEELSYPDTLIVKEQISPEFQKYPQSLLIVGEKVDWQDSDSSFV